MTALIENGLSLAHSARPVAFDTVLNTCESMALSNINSVLNMTSAVDRAVERLQETHTLTAQQEEKVREIKSRGARFRHDKKLASAAVADAAGYEGKAASLRKEAAALLSHDWQTIFPGETIPEEENSC